MTKHRKSSVPAVDGEKIRNRKRIPFFALAAVALVASGYLLSWVMPVHRTIPASFQQTVAVSQTNPLHLVREGGSSLVRPLLFVAGGEESSRFSGLKENLLATIRQWQQRQEVAQVSVYLKDLGDAAWMGIEADKTYLPGSLIKVPILLAFLKMEEEHPGTLNRSLRFEKPRNYFPSQEFKGDSIVPGKTYTISELLRYMIVESDNNATNLLSRNLDPAGFRKIFTDLQIQPDEINDVNYVISSREYSRFFRVLYNATYLRPDLSEYALDLLADSKFNSGITRTLPAGIPAPRKFGERGIDGVLDFSESAIIYKENAPYSLTIMTKGASAEKQAELVSELASIVFKAFPCR